VARTSRSSGNVTIVDVAQEAGVSYATVSRVLNNDSHVSPDTRERVIRSITRLGYTVNQQARMLAGGRAHVIGLLVPDLGTGYIGEIMRGVDEALVAAQYDLMLYTTHRRKTKESAYVASLTQGMTDGLLLVLPRDPGEFIFTLRQRHFPYVLIDHQGIGEVESSVGATNYQGGYDATKYLIDLGHQRIGFITGTLDLGCSRDRQAGYEVALHDHGLPVDPQLIQEGDFSQPSGFTAAQALLALPAAVPTAIFASNDVMAFGVMEAVRDRGLRIPEDISIVGFDNIPQAVQVSPQLTTVQQPLAEMGREAARRLLGLIQEPERPYAHVELPTRLIVRASTRALAEKAG
jgi:LacI family transcriptional regulator